MPTTSTTKTCPGCGTMVSAIRPTCRHCGTLLMEPPVPVSPLGTGGVTAPAPTEPGAVTASTGDDRFFAPATLAPVAVTIPPESKGRGPAFIAVIVIAVLALGAGAFVVLGGGGTSHAKTPVALPPHGASTGLPGGLGDAVRVQAESSRQIALETIRQASTADANALDLQRLSAASGSLTFHDANTSSKGPHDVSFEHDGDVSTIAIAASSKEVCAFGRMQPGTTSQYVTMINVSSCKATDAPADGWSALQGGSGADLPSDDPNAPTSS